MADAGQICNIACLHIVTDFLFPEEEDSLLEGNYDDTFVVLSSCCVFTRRKLARISRYFESTVPHYHCDVFRSHFRMTSSTFEMLSHFLSASDHIPKANRFGKPCIHPRKQIAVAVWALANQESCRQISDRFDVTMSSVTRCLRRVTKALVDVRGDFIQWPRGEQAIVVEEGFEEISGFPRVIGAVDGCHVPIRTPSEYPQSYLNRLKSHSIILQGTCDHKMLFTDIYVGWPGSVHDARVLRNSPLYQTAEHHFQGDSHLLGDSAYPLHRWLLTPFRDNGHLSRQEVNYNNKHAKTRQTIERAFGLLKGRWRKAKIH
ncbi:putative nuclease HARBI1 [Acropora muricata]|uniref:putative nuclease HARBI1 n=1 Tax=Acropora muricata TaxID=159855 RepID=UPI0034E5BABD